MRTELLQARELDEFVSCDHRSDRHALIELAEGGCPPELAVRILAPLNGDPS